MRTTILVASVATLGLGGVIDETDIFDVLSSFRHR
jgi:hypothetical protein